MAGTGGDRVNQVKTTTSASRQAQARVLPRGGWRFPSCHLLPLLPLTWLACGLAFRFVTSCGFGQLRRALRMWALSSVCVCVFICVLRCWLFCCFDWFFCWFSVCFAFPFLFLIFALRCSTPPRVSFCAMTRCLFFVHVTPPRFPRTRVTANTNTN